MSPARTSLEENAERTLYAIAEADRARRNDYFRSALACVAWAAVGLYCLAWSSHTTDVTLGTAAFYAGLGIGNGGIIFTILAAYRRGEARGDW